MKSFMLDIETLGRKPGAIILQIGLLPFEIAAQGGNISCDYDIALEVNIDADDSKNMGFFTEAETLEFWSKHPQQFESFGMNRRSVKTSLELINEFVFSIATKPQEVLLYCQGASFDPMLLGAYYEKLNMTPFWVYHNVIDIRSIQHFAREFHGVKKYYNADRELKHTALNDCIEQVNSLVYYISKIHSI